jgi:Family of unknown function (DUF6415)
MMKGTARPWASAWGSGMTMRVYTVDRYGTVTRDRGTITVAYGNEPLPSVMDTQYALRVPALPGGTGGGRVNATRAPQNDTGLVRIATMRETAALLLGPDDGPEGLPPVPKELDTLTATLRGHLGLLIPEVAAKAGRLPKNSVPRYCALACVGEANRKLRVGDGCTPRVRVAVARKLARSVKALCDHYEKLDGEASAGERS